MRLGPMTKKWLITILVATALVLLVVWIYTAWASEEVESEVGEEVSLVTTAALLGSGSFAAPVPGPSPARSS